MGRQICFYMLREDCEQFLRFVQSRDPVLVVQRDSDSSRVGPVDDPCSLGQDLCLWNQRLLPSLERKYIPQSVKGPYYRVDGSLPTLEFFLPRPADWDGRPALTQGRVYATFDQPTEGLRIWYEGIARWIRKNFTRNPIARVGGYAGPAALQWHRDGGLLLPFVRPLVTPQWRAILFPQSGKQAAHQ
jgi:hypothetical protein